MTDDDEQLYDVLIPPGVPRKLIIEIAKTFNVKTVERREKLTFANMDHDERDLLAFRGSLEEVQKVEKYMMEKLREFIEK